MRTGSRRHRISAASQVRGRRAGSLQIGLYTNFLDIVQLGPHTGDGEVEVHSGARAGQEEVFGYVEAGGDGRAEGKGGGLKRTAAGPNKSISDGVEGSRYRTPHSL